MHYTESAPTMHIDLRMLQKYGLTLDTKTRYHMVCCCHTWCVRGVYTDLTEAIRHLEGPYGDYDPDIPEKNYAYHAKGLAKNLDVWDLLRELSYTVGDETTSAARDATFRPGCLRRARRGSIVLTAAAHVEEARMMTRECAEFCPEIRSCYEAEAFWEDVEPSLAPPRETSEAL